VVDRVAYINHDIDDALRAGLLVHDELPLGDIELLGDRGSRRIDTLVHDLVEASSAAGDIVQSGEIGHAMLNLRAFMFERVYLGPAADEQRTTAAETLRRIFDHLLEHPEELPETRPGELHERVTDYVSGMTDRFALAWH
jgi:dGTPase